MGSKPRVRLGQRSPWQGKGAGLARGAQDELEWAQWERAGCTELHWRGWSHGEQVPSAGPTSTRMLLLAPWCIYGGGAGKDVGP